MLVISGIMQSHGAGAVKVVGLWYGFRLFKKHDVSLSCTVRLEPFILYVVCNDLQSIIIDIHYCLNIHKKRRVL